MINNKKWLLKFLHFISHFFLYLFILDILYPLNDPVRFQQMDVFVIFIIIMLIIYLYKGRLIHILIGFGTISIFLYYLYHSNRYLLFVRLIEMFYVNSKLLIHGNWYVLSLEYKTLLFFLLLWMIIIVFVAMLNRFKSFWIIVTVILYISMMDSFLFYDGKWAIVRVLGLGFIFMVFEKQRQLLIEAKEQKTLSLQFFITGIVLTTLIITIAFIVPKADAKWADPTGLFTNMQGKGLVKVGLEKVKTIGYGEDDSYLGGPFLQNDTVVMNTISSKKAYWRGESKDIYTGHGWINSSSNNASEYVDITGNENRAFPFRLIKNEAELEQKTVIQTLSFPTKAFQQFFFMGDFDKITVPEQPALKNAKMGKYSGKLEAPKLLKAYTVESTIPFVNIGLLNKATNHYTIQEKEYLKPYLQLPINLPTRVKDLAIKITENSDTPYDQVIAIDLYLRKNYTYNIVNVPVPGKNQDFVDQFLFESKRGYCNHFSTAMIVLAREVGIPARWVKGYTNGEVDYNNETKEFIGTVREKDAHSWVEVYFQGIGWISFDPTPNFSYPQEYQFTTPNQTTTNGIKDETNPVNGEVINTTNVFSEFSLINVYKIMKPFILWFVLLLIFLLLISFFRYRFELLVWLYKKQVSSSKISLKNMILLGTEKMILLTEKFYKKRDDSQTIRDYIFSAYGETSTEDWKEAIRIYERARYSKESISEEWRHKIWHIWIRLIKKIRP